MQKGALVLREYLRLVPLWAGKGQGFSGHMLTYGHAVLELERLGYAKLFRQAKEAFCQYCAISRRGPDAAGDDYPEPAADAYPYRHLTPTDPEYWTRRTTLDIGHGIKYPYALLSLLDAVGDGTHCDNLRRECLAWWWRLSPLEVPAQTALL